MIFLLCRAADDMPASDVSCFPGETFPPRAASCPAAAEHLGQDYRVAARTCDCRGDEWNEDLHVQDVHLSTLCVPEFQGLRRFC